MKNDKPFMTYEQQIRMLREDKQLGIGDENYAIALLKEYSYFALISGYKAPFKTKEGKYKLHTTIEDIYTLYCFDDKLRALFLQYILKIEKHVKSLMSYAFCKHYGEEQAHYLNVNNYNYNSKTQAQINELVSRLGDVLTHSKDYAYIKHQKRKHGNVPLWVMTKALTLGTISKMYSFLPQTLQAEISKEFAYVHEGMLIQMLDLLARVRNVCAHNERLYNYKYLKGTIDDTDVHRVMAVPKKKGHYKKGKNDLFAVVIVLKYLLSEQDFITFMNELENNVKELLQSTRSISKEQLQKYMGFPENWMDIKTCNKLFISEEA